MPPLDPRTGRPRQRVKAQIRKTHPLCHLCGQPPLMDVDRTRHPLASTIDELVPIALGGSALDPANLRHACTV